jgi:sec-independent protein translocase protein TatA
MFGSIGGPELLLIFVLALLLFGPRKLPEIGKTIGKTLAEFKKATNEFSTSLEREIELEKLKELKTDLKDPLPAGTIAKDAGTAPEPSTLPDGG